MKTINLETIREKGEYISQHRPGIAFGVVYGLEYSEDNEKLFLCRYKYPKWKMEIEENMVDKLQFANSLKKAAEWLRKCLSLIHI